MCITEQRVEEIIKHEVRPMEADLSGIRKVMFWGVTSLLTGMFVMGVWVGTIQSGLGNTQEELDIVRDQHNRFEDKVDARLERIENLLITLTDKVK